MGARVKPEDYIRRQITCTMCDTTVDMVAEQGSFPNACEPCLGQLHYVFWHLWREANETDRTA